MAWLKLNMPLIIILFLNEQHVFSSNSLFPGYASRCCYSQCAGGHVTTAHDGLQGTRPRSEAPQTLCAPPRDLCMNMNNIIWISLELLSWTEDKGTILDWSWLVVEINPLSKGTKTGKYGTCCSLDAFLVPCVFARKTRSGSCRLKMCFCTTALLGHFYYEGWQAFPLPCHVALHLQGSTCLSCSLPYWQRKTLVLHHLTKRNGLELLRRILNWS